MHIRFVTNYLKNNATFLSVVLRMLLKASIFQRAKSPGNYSPYIDLADIMIKEWSAITL